MPVFTQMWMCNAQCPKTHPYYRADVKGCSRKQCDFLDATKCKSQEFQNFCKPTCDRLLLQTYNLENTTPTMPTITRKRTF